MNAILFMLIGFQILVMPLPARYLAAGAVAITITLLARRASVVGVIWPPRKIHHFERGTIPVLTWGGLRGVASVAMALSLPADTACANVYPRNPIDHDPPRFLSTPSTAALGRSPCNSNPSIRPSSIRAGTCDGSDTKLKLKLIP